MTSGGRFSYIGKNRRRAKRMLEHYCSLTADDKADALADLLADLMHYADALATVDFDTELERARRHHADEIEVWDW